MNNVYYYELQDQIKFNTTEPIKVKDIVRSLEALEKIVKQSTKTFSKLTNRDQSYSYQMITTALVAVFFVRFH